MLTKSDLKAIETLLDPLVVDIKDIKKTIDTNERKNAKRHEQLQDSINIIVDDLGEDVTLLKDKTKRLEKHLGFAQIA